MCFGLGLVIEKIRKGSDLELELIEFVERLAMEDKRKGEAKMTLSFCV